MFATVALFSFAVGLALFLIVAGVSAVIESRKTPAVKAQEEIDAHVRDIASRIVCKRARALYLQGHGLTA